MFSFFLISLALSTDSGRLAPFVEGVATGLSVEISGAAECSRDVIVNVDVFAEVLQKLEAGVLSGSLVVRVGAALEELSHVFTVCSLFSVAEEMSRVASAMQSAEVVEYYQATMTLLQEDGKAGASMWREHEYFEAGVYIGRIVGTFMESTPKGRLTARAGSYFE